MAFDKKNIWSKVKTTGYILMWVFMCVGLMISLAFVNKQEAEIKCTEVLIDIDPENELRFIDRDVVLHTIRPDGNEKKIIGQLVTLLNVPALEKRLEANPYIEHAQVFTDMNGSLHIHIEQREPILRIINSKSETFYLDRNGVKMPASPLFTARVAVATGNIFEEIGDTLAPQSFVGRELLKIATYVDKDAFWKAQIEQIFVNEESELVLIPKIGDHIIRFGSTEDMETKFNKLMVFYKEALSRVGWDKYSVIDLRYKDQIVCKKK